MPSIEIAEDAPHPTDWRLRLPERRRRHLRIWLWSVAATTMAVLVVGGITRLTHSGLSIVDWDPLMGVIPPLSEGAWRETFDRYRQFPEYQLLRQGMTLGEFKLIYFWEYLHRLMARSIGVVFLVPFLVFWARGYLDRPLALRTLALFGLGGLQGLMGWLMVASGLVDRPSVSHFRLAAHLSLAFLIFGYALWLARELAVDGRPRPVDPGVRRVLGRGVGVVGTLLGLQVVWGAFVAGLKAGFFHNTFPLMGGRWVPAEILTVDPAFLDPVQNPATVQWLHRLIGTLLLLAAVGLAAWTRRAPVDPGTRRVAAVVAVLVGVQYVLGVVTLLYHVPVTLGVIHQAAALVVFGAWVWLAHRVQTSSAAPDRTSQPRASRMASSR